ncbi:thiol:disulfide interchange protein DsbA/DsbL [Thalassotalea sp. M1531]|uniref:Thiol:disulfide interchange protein n=1 Tax=Thalassotalea algicola TaxID=2716224 RepID=A0A7Y0LBH6_9GAMM|nr:thiol:disulfide interchange protein DsbA/DsbL [Thalassotalea algicola]NMP30010.1 thiol:disulfide interchange protein DsbA/DsbL [Thalassotalea algicola]
MPFKLFSFIFVVFFLSFPLFAEEFIEGRHYRVLDTPKAKQKEIREYFSFHCAPCYSQQSFMKELERGMPRRAKFVKNHVDGVEGQDPAAEKLLTKAVITAEKMRMKDKVVKALFERIQKQKQSFDTVEDIRALFISLGGSEFMFDSTFNSFSMDMMLEETLKNTELVRAAGEKSVPTLIINGKYKPLTGRITSMAQYKDLIYYLLRK